VLIAAPVARTDRPTKALPLHGQHTDTVLGCVLGKSETELAGQHEASAVR